MWLWTRRRDSAAEMASRTRHGTMHRSSNSSSIAISDDGSCSSAGGEAVPPRPSERPTLSKQQSLPTSLRPGLSLRRSEGSAGSRISPFVGGPPQSRLQPLHEHMSHSGAEQMAHNASTVRAPLPARPPLSVTSSGGTTPNGSLPVTSCAVAMAALASCQSLSRNSSGSSSLRAPSTPHLSLDAPPRGQPWRRTAAKGGELKWTQAYSLAATLFTRKGSGLARRARAQLPERRDSWADA